MNAHPSSRRRQVVLTQPRYKVSRLGGLACAAALMVGVSSVTAQEPDQAGKTGHTQATEAMRAQGCDLGCACCHTCAKPSSKDSCLPPCERQRDVYMRDQQGPEVVILDELEDVYLPVPFDHEGHARMAEMTKGCVVCHHYTPEGRQHPACKTCHSVEVSGVDIRKPGLKGAYHRQCLNCHKDWIDETACAICHQKKGTGLPSPEDEILPTRDDILGRMHPPIKEPTTEIYRADSREGAKSVVIFRHWEHVQGFDLNCVDCHHEENCSRCHKQSGEEEPPRTVREHHEPCLHCHKADMDTGVTTISGRCLRCHWQEGQPKIKPFEHEDTGWPLSRYHQGASCRDCHKEVPFVKQSKECDVCHSQWSPSTFDHRVTGQPLDENHVENDCEECHVDRCFDRPPTCDECHDEDEGISFPQQRPGSVPSATAPASS